MSLLTYSAIGLVAIIVPILLGFGVLAMSIVADYEGQCESLWGSFECPLQAYVAEGIFFSGILLSPFLILHAVAVASVFSLGWLNRKKPAGSSEHSQTGRM